MGERRDPHRFDDLFAEFGSIALRRFFGGESICAGQLMFGMVFGERIFFKTDDQTRKAFLAEACEPFTFEKRGETIVTGWYALPDRLYDDPYEVAAWARVALDVATRSETGRRKVFRKPDRSVGRRR
jgi:DNA transformation protein